jgi:hypothetical protein
MTGLFCSNALHWLGLELPIRDLGYLNINLNAQAPPSGLLRAHNRFYFSRIKSSFITVVKCIIRTYKYELILYKFPSGYPSSQNGLAHPHPRPKHEREAWQEGAARRVRTQRGERGRRGM